MAGQRPPPPPQTTATTLAAQSGQHLEVGVLKDDHHLTQFYLVALSGAVSSATRATLSTRMVPTGCPDSFCAVDECVLGKRSFLSLLIPPPRLSRKAAADLLFRPLSVSRHVVVRMRRCALLLTRARATVVMTSSHLNAGQSVGLLCTRMNNMLPPTNPASKSAPHPSREGRGGTGGTLPGGEWSAAMVGHHTTGRVAVWPCGRVAICLLLLACFCLPASGRHRIYADVSSSA